MEHMTQIYLKSGQSLELLVDKPFFVVKSWSLVNLKTMVSAHLGGTPSPQEIVLAHAYELALVELVERDVSVLQPNTSLFVFSAKVWHAQNVIQNTLSSSEDRRKAVVESYSKMSEWDLLKHAQAKSLQENRNMQATRQRLKEHAAVFELQENPNIDQKGNCQFDAAADQLRQYPQFAQESMVSVRAACVKWILENERRNLGNGITIRQWIEIVAVAYGHIGFDDYLDKMSRDQRWGDEVTLLAIQEVYQVCVVFISSSEQDWHRISYPQGKGPTEQLPQIWLGHELERHYWSLIQENKGARSKSSDSGNLKKVKLSTAEMDADIDGLQQGLHLTSNDVSAKEQDIDDMDDIGKEEEEKNRLKRKERLNVDSTNDDVMEIDVEQLPILHGKTEMDQSEVDQSWKKFRSKSKWCFDLDRKCNRLGFSLFSFNYFLALQGILLKEQRDKKQRRKLHDCDDGDDGDDVGLEIKSDWDECEACLRNWWYNVSSESQKLNVVTSMTSLKLAIGELMFRKNRVDIIAPSMSIQPAPSLSKSPKFKLPKPHRENNTLVFRSCSASPLPIDEFLRLEHSCQAGLKCISKDEVIQMLHVRSRKGYCETCGKAVVANAEGEFPLNCDSCAESMNNLKNCIVMFCCKCEHCSNLWQSRENQCRFCQSSFVDGVITEIPPMGNQSAHDVAIDALRILEDEPIIAQFIVNSLPEDLLHLVDVSEPALIEFFDDETIDVCDPDKISKSMKVSLSVKGDSNSFIALEFLHCNELSYKSRSCDLIIEKPVILVDDTHLAIIFIGICDSMLEIPLNNAVNSRLRAMTIANDLESRIKKLGAEFSPLPGNLSLGSGILLYLSKLSPHTLLRILLESPFAIAMEERKFMHAQIRNYVRHQPAKIAEDMSKDCGLMLSNDELSNFWKASTAKVNSSYSGIVSTSMAEEVTISLLQLLKNFVDKHGERACVWLLYNLLRIYHSNDTSSSQNLAPQWASEGSEPLFVHEDFKTFRDLLSRLAIALGADCLLSSQYGKAFLLWFIIFETLEPIVEVSPSTSTTSDIHRRITPWMADFYFVVNGFSGDENYSVEFVHKYGQIKSASLPRYILRNSEKLNQFAEKQLMVPCISRYTPTQGGVLCMQASEVAAEYGVITDRAKTSLIIEYGRQLFEYLPRDDNLVVVLSEKFVLNWKTGELLEPSQFSRVSDDFKKFLLRPQLIELESRDAIMSLSWGASINAWVSRWKTKYHGGHLSELLVLIAHFAMIMKRDIERYSEKSSVILSGVTNSGKTSLMAYFARMIGFQTAKGEGGTGNVVLNKPTAATLKIMLTMLRSMPIFINDPKEGSESFDIFLEHLINSFDGSSNYKMAPGGKNLLENEGNAYFIVSMNDSRDKQNQGQKGPLEVLLSKETSLNNRLVLVPVTTITEASRRPPAVVSSDEPSSVGFIQDVLRIPQITDEKVFTDRRLNGLEIRSKETLSHLLYYVQEVANIVKLNQVEQEALDRYISNIFFPLAFKYQNDAPKLSMEDLIVQEFLQMIFDMFSSSRPPMFTFTEENRFGKDKDRMVPFIFRPIKKSKRIRGPLMYFFHYEDYFKLFVEERFKNQSYIGNQLIARLNGCEKVRELLVTRNVLEKADAKTNKKNMTAKFLGRDGQKKDPDGTRLQSKFDVINLDSSVVGKFFTSDRKETLDNDVSFNINVDNSNEVSNHNVQLPVQTGGKFFCSFCIYWRFNCFGL
jgi:hypothetical protein